MNKIARFEALAEQLVEGTFARLFAGQLSPLEVAAHLARAIEDGQATSPDGVPQAPTHYWIYLHPDDCDALADDQQAFEAEMAHHVARLAAQAGLALPTAPAVHVLPDDESGPHQVRIEAQWTPEHTEPLEKTRELPPEDEAEATAPPPGRPFLILEGKRHANLLQPIVSIGRALDNDVIVDDPRVSRHHAQLRRRYDRYVLYDLASSGGTRINDYPVEECVLHAGDVISLAGVQIIYSEDPPTPILLPEDENTPPLPQGEKETHS